MPEPQTTFFSINHWEIVAARELIPGVTALIAIHSTKRGPSLGGCRMFDYGGHPLQQMLALEDVLRLSRGMSYKAAAANLPLGGGKAVILADSEKYEGEERRRIFTAFGEFIDSLEGRYITAEDVGTKVSDMTVIHGRTRHVTGLPPSEGGLGDPSPITAYGVFESLCFTADRFIKKPFHEITVAVQGAGKVGHHLCLLLKSAGFKIKAADVSADNIERIRAIDGIEVVAPETIVDTPADIFAPCAMGKILNAETLPRLQAKVICGAANNQLESAAIDVALLQRGIIYAPDYVVNLGGLTLVQHELAGKPLDAARASTRENAIAGLKEIYDLSAAQNLPTGAAADRVVYRRFHS